MSYQAMEINGKNVIEHSGKDRKMETVEGIAGCQGLGQGGMNRQSREVFLFSFFSSLWQ